MAANQQQPAESGGLEDQIRRMILNDGSSNPTHPHSVLHQHAHPVVSLPPRGAHMMPQNQMPLYSNQAPANSHNQNRAFPHDPSIIQSQRGRGDGARLGPVGRGGYQRTYQPGPSHDQPRPQSFRGRGANLDQSAHHQNQQQRARFQQQVQVDPNAFQRAGYGQPPPQSRQHGGHQQLFNPHGAQHRQHFQAASSEEHHVRQMQYLEQVAAAEISNVEMSPAECDAKEAFRISLQHICHNVCEMDPARLPSVSLECFGSFRSGFATAGSDMDLVIVVKDQSPTSACFSLFEDDLPRALEQQLLQLGYGARLLTRTRVPIIKVCEKPGTDLLEKLREERAKWDDLPPEKKYPHLYPEQEVAEGDDAGQAEEADATAADVLEVTDGAKVLPEPSNPIQPSTAASLPSTVPGSSKSQFDSVLQTGTDDASATQDSAQNNIKASKRPEPKPWTRERNAGPLDFPKTGVGIQSDINFFNPLGLHNTQLLRCYSLCDPRVRPMILFVKAWAKRRKINSSYSGTLSSYGHVLMVLHYLMNIAQPPVLPNLQSSWRPPGARPADASQEYTVEGCSVSFWRDEEEIYGAAQRGLLTSNRQSLGSLLARFFHYYSSQGGGMSFRWMQEVLSLRTMGGLLTKEDKGWVKAKTEEGEGKRIQHRFLFCIEDPFELNHNVARTVTHNGIVAIRDEFRRAYRILNAVGNGQRPRDGELFAQLLEAEDFRAATKQLKANAAFGSVSGEAARNGPLPQHAMHSNGASLPRPPGQHVPGNQRQSHHGQMRQHGKPVIPTPDSFNPHDEESFPTLGKMGKAPRRKKPAASDKIQVEQFSEISGDKAKVILEEVRRKKDEAQAESTAMGAAAAVLEDFD